MTEDLPPLALACTDEGMEMGAIALFQAMQLDEAWYDSVEEEASGPSTAASSHECLDDEEAGTEASTGVDAGLEPFPFMALPLELRLQVYRWAHISQPLVTAPTTPWYPAPIYHPYVSRRVHAGPRPKHEPGLLCAFRPTTGMPTALLQANRQLYHEMRGIPFADDEFEFVNWFASGLWAARSFLKPLSPWQRDAMRYIRLDILVKDLVRVNAADWIDLCGLWARGLWGMRLRIAGYGPFGAWMTEGLPQGASPRASKEGNVRDLPRKWLEAGLNRLAALRYLEIELAVPQWDGAGKVAWCAVVQDAINSRRTATQPRLEITCVEKC